MTKQPSKRTRQQKPHPGGPDDLLVQWEPLEKPPESAEQITKYEATSARVIAAVTELNEALKEAHANQEMSVHLWADTRALPRQYQYRIYRLTHATLAYRVTLNAADADSDATPFWKRTVGKPRSETGAA